MTRYYLIFVFAFTFVALASSETTLRYAENFEVIQRSGYKELIVRNTWVGAKDAEQRYLLVPRGKALPVIPENAFVIRTPVRRMVTMETVFLGPIDELDLYEQMVGMAYVDYTHNEIAKRGVREGRIKEVPAGVALDIETLLELEPELILCSTIGSSTFDGHLQMRRFGLPAVVSADYMERHPLARAEWIKFLAVFFGKEAEAEAIFNEIAEKYELLAQRVSRIQSSPTVMYGAPYGGVWHVPGGKSYMAKALTDAGADYLWANNSSSGGVPVDMEVIFRKAAHAKYWLHPSYYDSMSSLLSADERYASFKASREGRVYNNTRRVNEGGGNDIFERGVAHPEEVLADLIKIFHPELMTEHEFIYYELLQ